MEGRVGCHDHHGGLAVAYHKEEEGHLKKNKKNEEVI